MSRKHARQQIREKLESILGGLPTTQANVFTGNPWKLQASQIPGLVIVASTDVRNDEFSSMNGRDARTLQVVLMGYAKGEHADDECDTIALEVEKAIANDPTLGGLVKEIVLQSTEFSVADASERVGMITLTFAAIYRVQRAAPETIIA